MARIAASTSEYAAALQLVDGRHRLFAGAGADERVIAKLRSEVAPDRRQHLRIVVDKKNDRLVEHCACAEERQFAASGSHTRNSVRPGILD